MVREAPKRSSRRVAAKVLEKENETKEEEEERENDSPAEEFRFKHLLEPIRDLAVNWNVDIARDLEGYLGELEVLEISLDGGSNLLNFAEAALLIQGSTCVYSKKVEYLHKLVFNVLSIISDTKQRVQRAEEDEAEDGSDPDTDFPEDPEFIALDDIPEAKPSSINMADDGEGDGGDHLVEATPMVLMMNFEDDLHTTDPNKDLRLANAEVHSSGALLLDASYSKRLDARLEPIDTGGDNNVLSPERIRADDAEDALALAAQALAGGAEEDAAPFAPPSELEAGADEDFDDGGWGADAAAGAAGAAGAACKADPWALLDPHDASGGRPKPFAKGRTWRRPAEPAAGQARGARVVAASQVELDVSAHQSRSLKLAYFADFAGAFLHERSRMLAARAAEARAHRPAGGAAGRVALQLDDDDYDEVDLPHLHGDASSGVDAGAGFGPDAAGGDEDWAPLPEEFPALDSEDEGAAFGAAAGGAARPWVGAAGVDPRAVDEMSYQDMCKVYIDRYLRGVEDFMHQTELERRVSDWHKNIEPKLREEEERPAFDIHAYGERVKARIAERAPEGEDAPAVPFAAAVQGMTRHDVCRALLATLQLANDGNVELSLADDGDRTSVAVRIVSVEAAYKALGAYEAPSVASARKKTKTGRGVLGASPLRPANARAEASAEAGKEDGAPAGAAAVAEALASQAVTQPVKAVGKRVGRRGADKEN